MSAFRPFGVPWTVTTVFLVSWDSSLIREVYKRRLWKEESLSRGTPLEGSFTGDSERHMKEGSENRTSLSMGALRGETGGRLLYWEL